MKKTLVEIFKEIGNHSGIDCGANDKNSTHTYLETYDKLFEPFRDGCAFLEIGLALGDSIKLWDRYFENSKIVGIDISVVFPMQEYKNDVVIIEADATKPEILKCFEFTTFDLVVEDSSHMEADSIAIFNLFKSKMKPGSLYIVEDVISLDSSRPRFEALHDNCEIIDMRDNGRFDNVLIIYKF